MTRKDYELLAGVLRRARAATEIGSPQRTEIVNLISDIGSALAATYPNFDLHRFNRACLLDA